MNFNIKFIIVSLAMLLGIASCGDKPTSKASASKDNHDHGHSHGEAENGTSTSLTEAQIKTVGITFGSIEYKQLTDALKSNGFLRVPNNNKANATSMFGGVVRKINVEEGDFVRAGQVIAIVENPDFVNLQEEYIALAGKITFAEQEHTRQKELNEGGAGALKNLQSIQSDIRSYRARRAALQKQIEMMGISPGKLSSGSLRSSLTITSPVSGTVSRIIAKIGSYVDVATPVAEIVDNSQLHLDIQVFEKDLPKLKVGQIIHFTLTNNPVTEYDAKVYSIGSSFEDDSKTISVHCKVVGNKKGLIDGMNVTALVSLDNAVMPAVPNDAIVEVDGKPYIFVVKEKATSAASHDHDHGAEGHDHAHDHAHENSPTEGTYEFERIEVVTGVSELGYTAITLVGDIPNGAKIVTKGAFFINAKMTNKGDGHAH